MAINKIIAASLLGTALTRAQQVCSASGGPTATTVLSKSADATSLASACPTWTGSISIDGGALNEAIDLSGLQTINGNLSVLDIDAFTGKVYSSSILNVTGNVEILYSSNTALLFSGIGHNFTARNWNFPSGTSQVLPEGQGLTRINGSLTLDGTTLSLANYDIGNSVLDVDVIINNNTNLGNIAFTGTDSLGRLQVTNNGRGSNLAGTGASLYLTGITGVAGLIVSDIGSLHAVNIATILGDINVTRSSDSDLYLPATDVVLGGLAVSDSVLSSIKLPLVASLPGGLRITDNPNLQSFGYELPNLKTIGSDVYLRGTFTDVSFNNLTFVNGSMTIISNSSLACASAAARYAVQFRGNNVISGDFLCSSANGNVSVPAGNIYSSLTPSAYVAANNGSTSSGLSPGAGAGIGVGIGIAAIIAGALLIYWRRRRSRHKRDAVPSHDDDDVSDDQFGKTELATDESRFEMENHDQVLPWKAEVLGSGNVTELPAKHTAGALEMPANPKDLTELPNGTSQGQELDAGHGRAELMAKRASTGSYHGMLVGSEWRHEAPGDTDWHDNDNSSIVEETAISKAAPSTVAGSAVVSPTSDATATGRVSHFREGVSPVAADGDPILSQQQQSLPAAQVNDGLRLPEGTSRPLECHPGVSSVAPSERQVVGERTGLLSTTHEPDEELSRP